MNEFEEFMTVQAPTAARPLLGQTVLVVEDSRFACEAIRMMALRSGARIRLADCLRSARRHLRVYRPSIVIIDLGLPDGSGAELLGELRDTKPRVEVLLATSGDEGSQDEAMAAGADGFLAKPLAKLAEFQAEILRHLPADKQPAGLRVASDDVVGPDHIAYQNDMAYVADVLSTEVDGPTIDYVTQFLAGLARSAGDSELAIAAGNLNTARRRGVPVRSELALVAGIVQERMSGKIAI